VKADARQAIAGTVMTVATRVSFGAAIVLSPFRGRIELATRRTPPIYGEFTDVLLAASDVAVLATLVCWFVSRVLRRDRLPLVFGPRFISWPITGLLTISALGIPFSVDPALTAVTTVRFTLLAAFALYVVNEVATIRRLVAPVALMVVVQAVVGIGQVIDQRSLSLGWLGEHELRTSLGVSVVTTADGVRVLRAYGLSDHPNILGGLLAFAVVLLVGAAATTRRDRGSALQQLSLVALALGGACLFLTFSRGAWIGAIAGTAVLLAMVGLGTSGRSGLRHGAVAMCAVAIGAAPFVAPYHEVLQARTEPGSTIATEARSIDEREELTRVASRIVADHPFVGVGLGALPLAMLRAEPDFRFDHQPAASVLLDVTAETGFVGGFAYLVIIVAPWIALLRRWRSWSAELAAASGLLTAITLIGVVDYYTWSYASGRLWMWLILGLWAGAFHRARHDAPRTSGTEVV
jgi:putative inorganic carbon (hco3(-)) transporter